MLSHNVVSIVGVGYYYCIHFIINVCIVNEHWFWIDFFATVIKRIYSILVCSFNSSNFVYTDVFVTSTRKIDLRVIIKRGVENSKIN